jgi:molybdopterin-guanine dinucleotide biosynthesis protein
MVEEGKTERDPRLEDVLKLLRPDNHDRVFVEGFKHERFPKLELQRRNRSVPALTMPSAAGGEG